LKNKFNKILLSLFVGVSSFAADFSVSGFGTVAVTKTDNDQTLFRASSLSSEGSQGDYSLYPDSKVGLRVDTNFNNNLSASIQTIATMQTKTSDDIRLDWANLKYRFNDEFSIFAGRLKAPIYLYSDILDVSYVHPYIRLPQEIYTFIPFFKLDGVQLNHHYIGESCSLDTSIYYGSSKETLINDVQNNVTSDFNTDDMYGISLTSSFDDFKIRTSYTNTKITITNPDLDNLFNNLSLYGFDDVTKHLEIDEKEVNVYTIGLTYDNLDYFVTAEAIRIDTDSLVQGIDTAYISAGYRIDKFTPYITLADSSQKKLAPQTSIPAVGPAAALRYAIDSTAAIMNLSQRSVSFGTRYELADNMSLKFQYDKIDVSSDHQTIHIRYPEGNQNLDDINVYSVAIDWVF
jgi:hypothetical protein